MFISSLSVSFCSMSWEAMLLNCYVGFSFSFSFWWITIVRTIMNQLLYYCVIYLLILGNTPSSQVYFFINILTRAFACANFFFFFFWASNYMSIRYFDIDFDMCICFSLKIFYLFFRLVNFHSTNIKLNVSSLLSIVYIDPIQWICCHRYCSSHFWVFHLFLL